jgi:hypothetical protein
MIRSSTAGELVKKGKKGKLRGNNAYWIFEKAMVHLFCSFNAFVHNVQKVINQKFQERNRSPTKGAGVVSTNSKKY